MENTNENKVFIPWLLNITMLFVLCAGSVDKISLSNNIYVDLCNNGLCYVAGLLNVRSYI